MQFMITYLLSFVFCPFKQRDRNKNIEKKINQYLLESDIVNIVKAIRSFDIQLKCLLNDKQRTFAYKISEPVGLDIQD